MEITVFYAWQSDRDKKVNRYFIQEAAEKALKRITDDASIDFSLKLDHDTKDVPGMPEITTTILKKIEESHIFLADLTFVAIREAEEPRGKSKYVPNPNVLFELGYAFKSLGSERIICVMNTGYGDAELQIFDLAHRRWPIRYELTPEDQANKADVRKSLGAEIESAVRSILKSGTITNRNEASQEQLRAERMAGWIKDGRQRWNELVKKDLRDEIPSRYQHGIWTFAYSIIGTLTVPNLSELESMLKKVAGRETGWPVWWVPDLSYTVEPPYPRSGTLECWLKDAKPSDSAHSDFWRASSEGTMFLLRGYQEDCTPDKVSPGKYLWAETPIWDVSECLLHARRLSLALGDEEARITFTCTWEGLAGRTLRHWSADRDEETWFDMTKRTCQQPLVESSVMTISSPDIEPNLPEIVKEFTKVLYQSFRFYEPEMNMFQREISKMRKRGL